MTKAEWKRAKRLSPVGEDGVALIRQIASENQAQKVNEVTVDAFSARWFIQVYDGLNDVNRGVMRGLCIGEAMSLVWRMAERTRK